MEASLCSVPSRSCFLKKHFKVDPSPIQKACKVLDYKLNLKKEELRVGSFDAEAAEPHPTSQQLLTEPKHTHPGVRGDGNWSHLTLLDWLCRSHH